MKAIVLSGGGSKGSYQIGCWKALKKLHIKYEIVTGTSVGALNGALMTQKSYHLAIKLWKKINLKVLFGNEATESKSNIKVMKMYSESFIKNGGMDAKKLECLINKILKKNKFYNSTINYGLVTVNLSSKKPLQITKNNIPKKYLSDYLIASASCYPAFKTKDIKGEKFIDGGVADNLPINLAIKMGANSIIAIDLCAPGFKQKPKKKVDIITIKPNNKLTNFLNFYEEGAKRNMKFGYNDTMKIFGKYEGKKYTFKKNSIKKNKNKHKETFNYTINKIINTDQLIKTFSKLIKDTDYFTDKMLLKIMEELGKNFNIDETKIYSYKKYNKILLKELKNNNNGKIAKLSLKSKNIIIDIYNNIKSNNYKSLRKQLLLTPIEFLESCYLYTISED